MTSLSSSEAFPGYVVLGDLDFDTLPPSISVDEVELVKKSEFHITLLLAKRLAPLISDEENEQITENIVSSFYRYAETHDFAYQVLPQLRSVKRDEKQTVIAMARVSNLQPFYDQLNHEYDTVLPAPPMHVTLYSRRAEEGISLMSQEQLERDSVAITLPAIEAYIGKHAI